MKIVNGILSILLALIAMYLFIQSNTTQDLMFAFITMLMSIVFICFMMIEEHKEENDRLKRIMRGDR